MVQFHYAVLNYYRKIVMTDFKVYSDKPATIPNIEDATITVSRSKRRFWRAWEYQVSKIPSRWIGAESTRGGDGKWYENTFLYWTSKGKETSGKAFTKFGAKCIARFRLYRAIKKVQKQWVWDHDVETFVVTGPKSDLK